MPLLKKEVMHITLHIQLKNNILGAYTFYSSKTLESVVLPKNLTAIDHNAFSVSEKLQSVKLFKGIRSIGDNAFQIQL